MLSLRAFSFLLAASLGVAGLGCDGGSGSGAGGAAGQTTGPETGGGGSGGATSGSGGTGGTAGTAGTGGTGTTFPGMTLTSPDILEGGMFPATHTCAGDNTSPQLDWTPGPAGTKSYSVILKDQTNNLIHSAIWDIPGDALGLPAGVEKAQNPSNVPGAKQTTAYDSKTYGYLGPCPSGSLHTYQFTVFALDVLPLPVVGIPAKESILDLSMEHQLASATLTAQSDAMKP